MGLICSVTRMMVVTSVIRPGVPWVLVLSLMSAVTSHWNPLIAPCSGEGPRYGDYKCIHDRTHRVCAKLVEDSQSCEEVRWPRPGSSEAVSFWDITGQQRWNWKRSVCQGPNPGDSWCICMWAAANLVAEVGCDNMELNCAATDMDYVLRANYDWRWNLSNFKSCLRQKCVKGSDGKYRNRS